MGLPCTQYTVCGSVSCRWVVGQEAAGEVARRYVFALSVDADAP